MELALPPPTWAQIPAKGIDAARSSTKAPPEEAPRAKTGRPCRPSLGSTVFNTWVTCQVWGGVKVWEGVKGILP